MTEELIKPFEIINGNIVLELPEKVDIQITRAYIRNLTVLLEESPQKSIIINTDMNFQLSSVYFGFMMTLQKFSRDHKMEFKLVCNTPKVLQMIDMLKIGHLFTLCPTLQSATES
jgi:anti-anti-sigma regulatory factor